MKKLSQMYMANNFSFKMLLIIMLIFLFNQEGKTSGIWGNQNQISPGASITEAPNMTFDNEGNIYVIQQLGDLMLVLKSTDQGQNWGNFYDFNIPVYFDETSPPSIMFYNDFIYVLYSTHWGSDQRNIFLYKIDFNGISGSNFNPLEYLYTPEINPGDKFINVRLGKSSDYLFMFILLSSSNSSIFYYHSPDGESWSNYEYIAQDVNSEGGIGIDGYSSSGLFVAYIKDNNKVAYRQTDYYGSPNFSTEQIAYNNTEGKKNLALSVYDDKLSIVYQKTNSLIPDIYGLYSNDAGTNWSSYGISINYIYGSRNPWVSHDGEGNFYACYFRNDEIYAQIGDQNPQVSEEVQISSGSNASSDYLTSIVGFENSSGAVATWMAGSNNNLYCNYYLRLLPPQNVEASQGDFTDKIRITWDDVPGAPYYKVYIEDFSGNYIPLTGDWLTVTEYDHYSVNPCEYNYYKISAATNANGANETELSSEDYGYSRLMYPPNFTASAGDFTNYVHLEWDIVSQAAYYLLFRSTVDNFSNATLIAITPQQYPENSYDDDQVTPLQIYYYWIKASNVDFTNYCSSIEGESVIGWANTSSPSITVTPPSLNFTDLGGVQQVNVSSNVSWTTIGAPTWIIMAPNSGGSGNTTIDVTASQNMSSNERTAIITFTGGGTNATLSITQQGQGTTSCLDCPNYDFNIATTSSWQTHSSSIVANGCKMYRLNVTNGTQYIFKTGCVDGAIADYDTKLELYNSSCSLVASDDDACENNLSKIEWTANFSGYAYLKVFAYGSDYGNYTIAYTQVNSSPNLTISNNLIPNPVSSSGGDYFVTVQNTGTGTLNWHTSGVPSWVYLEPAYGNTNNSQDVLVTIDPNNTGANRSCTIDFINNDNPSNHQTITINQLTQGPGTYVCGDVSGTWSLAGSPYFICTDGVTVQENDQLIIEHGVVVKFQGASDITVDGKLKVNGTNNSRVIFCAENQGEPWDDITIYSPNYHSECYIKYADFINGSLEIKGNSLIQGCNFKNCTSNNSEVVIITPQYGGNSQFIDCSFENNSFKNVLYVDYDTYTNTPSFTNCTFENNQNTQDDNAIILLEGNSRPTFTNCSFLNNFNNNSTSDGGAIGIEDESSAVFNNCTFSQNHANDEAGAVAIDPSSNQPSEFTSFYRCSFINNTAGDIGGAVCISMNGKAIFETCLFTNNNAGNKGGAVATSQLNGNSWFVNCVFDNNSAYNGGNVAYVNSYGGLLNFTNSIILESSNIFLYESNYVSCYYSVIPYGSGNYMKEGCTNEDPNLDNNYYPLLGSVCINNGTQNTNFLPPYFIFSVFDFNGDPRIIGSNIDIGIFETNYSSPPEANFSGYPLSGTAPLQVFFTDQSTNNPTSWAWDFGDGGTSISPNPQHTYSISGSYTVSLTATNQYGSDTETKNDYIQVNQGQVPVVITTAVTDITESSAISGGNVTNGGSSAVTARGVCWSTQPNPTLANDFTIDGNGTGVFVSNLVGLTSNNQYYVRAYATNSLGTAFGNQIDFTTLASFTCGSSITINHVTGSVAPITKTVMYGTVTNIPGESLKCWITSNLGSDHQATAVNDATEASAGWYWQFNRKQGYKHTGTVRTPNTAWITSISENSDWIAANDPCSLELGIDWRIPTKTEWNNISFTGNWTNWNGPWNSELKMHAAGMLNYSEGTLNNRGSYGRYWSSNQESDATFIGYNLFFYSGLSHLSPDHKSFGFPLRCLRNAYSAPTTCGNSITIDHVAGTVAPVTKTVTYGTVTNIPGQPSKCWITSNLGSDHQATSVDDASEASAGWYWQFNRKQGFKHDGTTVTPLWTIISINENLDWQAVNDPCILDLGGGWRIPTMSEWENLDAIGTWTDWNGPWNSDLKLHAAGMLNSNNGSLYGRGSGGYYSSSTQFSADMSLFLSFSSLGCNWIGASKAYGNSLRCVRDDIPVYVDEAGVSPNSKQSYFKIYPNPTTDIVNVEWMETGSNTEAHLTVYSILGEKILHKTSHGESKFQFSLSGLPIGIYLVNVQSGQRSEVAKVVKN